MAELIYIRGEGGAVWKMTRPLPKPVQQRLDKGQISRVNADGTPYREPAPTPAPAAPAPDPVPDPAADTPPAEPSGTEPGGGGDTGGRRAGRPPQAAPKTDWIDYVVAQGKASREDAEAYTKADLIDMVS